MAYNICDNAILPARPVYDSQSRRALLLLFFFAKIEQFYVLSYHLMFVVLQKEIKGTANLSQNPVAHMRIDLGCSHTLMTQQLLHLVR